MCENKRGRERKKEEWEGSKGAVKRGREKKKEYVREKEGKIRRMWK